ncbi:peptidoglycan-binding domain-containing protein [Pseudanabaena mucicola]|uniref:Peptidoglycan-binding protein n=1 Tax=Pseudanabaena mucicola FACHB-723 TaxID=2692860 RepID=A0ABR7ZY83_9CYAN|nr:peptidoglycan-binding domain-containing protein [Pseudanabaena mucicola]MBD2188529.1 peptidoglycan-binding protein [Pseudanabaena mucicola FACHB-723]
MDATSNQGSSVSNSTTAPTSSLLPILLSGATGTAVAQAQQLLKNQGYYQGQVDGDFGMKTRDAIVAFQRANSLTIDGKVGAQTWQKLQELAPQISLNEESLDSVDNTKEPFPKPIASIFIPTSNPSKAST